MEKEFHPIANIFPMMSEEETKGLTEDISQNGLKESIWLHPDGRIIDGRNRYNACQQAGVEPVFNTWNGKGSLVAFVISLNLHRRHLSSIQKAAVGFESLPFLEAEAKERQLRTSANREKAKEEQNLVVQKIAQQDFAPKEENKSRTQAAKMVGTNKQYISDMKKYKEECPDVFDAAKEGKVNGSQAKAIAKLDEPTRKTVITRIAQEPETPAKSILRDEQQRKRVNIAKDSETSTRACHQSIHEITTKYRVIYADPPWFYGNDQTKAMPGSTRPEDHYVAMPLQDICDLPVKRITLDDAVLFLWVTSPLLEESFQVIRAWGFKYKTSFVWDKVKHNFGHYNSVRHELLLIATKGSCTPDKKILHDSVQSIERTEHSAKPDVFRGFIDELYDVGNRIELFSRTKNEGWDSWGNQL